MRGSATPQAGLLNRDISGTEGDGGYGDGFQNIMCIRNGNAPWFCISRTAERDLIEFPLMGHVGSVSGPRCLIRLAESEAKMDSLSVSSHIVSNPNPGF